MEGEERSRAADERLRSWLRRAGRSADNGKGYGATGSGPGSGVEEEVLTKDYEDGDSFEVRRELAESTDLHGSR